MRGRNEVRRGEERRGEERRGEEWRGERTVDRDGENGWGRIGREGEFGILVENPAH